MQDNPSSLNSRSNKYFSIKFIWYLVQTLVGFSKCTGCQSELSGWLCQVSPSRDGCLCCATQLFRKIYYVNNNSFTHIVPIHSGFNVFLKEYRSLIRKSIKSVFFSYIFRIRTKPPFDISSFKTMYYNKSGPRNIPYHTKKP